MIFFSKKKMLSIVLLLAFLGGCGWFWRHREYIPFVSQPLSVGAAPFEYGVSRAAWLGENGIGLFRQVFSNWKELDELRKENESLKSEQDHYSEILAENIRLRSLLQFKQGYTSYHMLGASVIERDYGGWTHTMVIDRGEDSGLKKYMPVIVPSGIVGFVSEVYLNSARVQLLLDPRTTIGGIVQRPASRVVSMVSGNSGNPGYLSLVSLPKEADVIKGDTAACTPRVWSSARWSRWMWMPRAAPSLPRSGRQPISPIWKKFSLLPIISRRPALKALQ